MPDTQNDKEIPLQTLIKTAEKIAAKKAAKPIEKSVEKTDEKSGCGAVATFGDGDLFQLLSQQPNEIVRAMEIDRVGCIVKTTKVLSSAACETTVFVPGTKIKETKVDGKVTARKLVHF